MNSTYSNQMNNMGVVIRFFGAMDKQFNFERANVELSNSILMGLHFMKGFEWREADKL
jgi:hypothetical protein